MKLDSFTVVVAAALAVVTPTIIGCGERKPAEGPVEKAGRKVDDAASDTKEAAKEVKEDVKKKTD